MKAGTSFWIITCMAREGCLRIEHRKGAETGHTVSGRLCTGRFVYLYDRMPGNRFLGYPKSDADFFSGNRVSGIFFISAEKKRTFRDGNGADRYDSCRSAASCRYCDVFWNEYWWYAVCHDPAIWLERNFAEPELLSAAGSVLYSGGQYGNQPAGSPGRAEERQNAGISYGRKKEKQAQTDFFGARGNHNWNPGRMLCKSDACQNGFKNLLEQFLLDVVGL